MPSMIAKNRSPTSPWWHKMWPGAALMKVAAPNTCIKASWSKFFSSGVFLANLGASKSLKWTWPSAPWVPETSEFPYLVSDHLGVAKAFLGRIENIDAYFHIDHSAPMEQTWIWQQTWQWGNLDGFLAKAIKILSESHMFQQCFAMFTLTDISHIRQIYIYVNPMWMESGPSKIKYPQIASLVKCIGSFQTHPNLSWLYHVISLMPIYPHNMVG